MEKTFTQKYAEHLARVMSAYDKYMQEHNLDAVYVHVGEPEFFFNDDHEKQFRCNPFALHLVPEVQTKQAWHVVKRGAQQLEVLYVYQDSYWELKQPVDFSPYGATLKVHQYPTATELAHFFPNHAEFAGFIGATNARVAVIGPSHESFYVSKGFATELINPQDLIKDIETVRRVKDYFELDLLYQAQALAIKAHEHFKTIVTNGNFTEMQLLGNYLNRAQMQALEQGYTSIIAYNRNAAILHYNILDFELPEVRRSILLDAGATYKGYQADITRTYGLDGNELFKDLILGVGEIKDTIIDNMAPGVVTNELQQLMYRKTAELLIDAEVIKDATIEQAMELKIPHGFVPHGFGHSMGIGVHDVLGHPTAPRVDGQRTPHCLEVGNVWTIEPGIYFIDSILAGFQANEAIAKHLDFEVIEEIYEHGGIRVEDNVYLDKDHLINLTASLDNM